MGSGIPHNAHLHPHRDDIISEPCQKQHFAAWLPSIMMLAQYRFKVHLVSAAGEGPQIATFLPERQLSGSVTLCRRSGMESASLSATVVSCRLPRHLYLTRSSFSSPGHGSQKPIKPAFRIPGCNCTGCESKPGLELGIWHRKGQIEMQKNPKRSRQRRARTLYSYDAKVLLIIAQAA